MFQKVAFGIPVETYRTKLIFSSNAVLIRPMSLITLSRFCKVKLI